MTSPATNAFLELSQESSHQPAKPTRGRLRTRGSALLGDIRYDCSYMTQQPPTKIHLEHSSDYRENYANSIQIRVNLWDFFLLFGLVNQTAPDQVAIQNFQGIYVSPQQAKALLNVLQQNVTQYEAAFGEIKLEPQAGAGAVQ